MYSSGSQFHTCIIYWHLRFIVSFYLPLFSSSPTNNYQWKTRLPLQLVCCRKGKKEKGRANGAAAVRQNDAEAELFLQVTSVWTPAITSAFQTVTLCSFQAIRVSVAVTWAAHQTNTVILSRLRHTLIMTSCSLCDRLILLKNHSVFIFDSCFWFQFFTHGCFFERFWFSVTLQSCERGILFLDVCVQCK